jgi:hypothetical protein
LNAIADIALDIQPGTFRRHRLGGKKITLFKSHSLVGNRNDLHTQLQHHAGIIKIG